MFRDSFCLVSFDELKGEGDDRRKMHDAKRNVASNPSAV